MYTSKIKKHLRSLADEDIAARAKRYMKTGPGEYGEGDRILGIRTPVLRSLARIYKDIPLDDVTRLLQSPFHEERALALFVLVDQFKRADKTEQRRIYSLYRKQTKHINGWDLVDCSASQIVGAWLHDRDRQPLYRLATSNNLWERRIAMLATFYQIRRKQFSDTLALAEILLNDDEDLIHKAVGWMLREVSNRDPAAGRRFLQRHYTNMPRTMLRYAIEKFPQRERLAYLKGEI